MGQPTPSSTIGVAENTTFDAGQDAPRPRPSAPPPTRADATQKHTPYGQTSLKITLRDPKYDPLKEVVVKISGRKVADVKGTKRLEKSVTGAPHHN